MKTFTFFSSYLKAILRINNNVPPGKNKNVCITFQVIFKIYNNFRIKAAK